MFFYKTHQYNDVLGRTILTHQCNARERDQVIIIITVSISVGLLDSFSDGIIITKYTLQTSFTGLRLALVLILSEKCK